MATLTQLKIALVNADKAGDTEAAKKLADTIINGNFDESGQLVRIEKIQPATIKDKIIGAGEAALTLASGATTGTIGAALGTAKGIAKAVTKGEFGTQEGIKLIDQEQQSGMQAGTYMPRTESGLNQVQFLANIAEKVPPTLGPVSTEAAILSNVLKKTATPVAKAAAKSALSKIAENTIKSPEKTLVNKLKSKMTKSEISEYKKNMMDESAMARQEKADQLSIPIPLTKGQKTREFEQQRFERETAKLPDVGKPLRDTFLEQNEILLKNLDNYIDMTKSEAPDLRSVGISVSDAINKRAQIDRKKISKLYEEAEKNGDMNEPVKVDNFARYLEENKDDAALSKILELAKSKAKTLGIIEEDTNGNLITIDAPIKKIEILRKTINENTDYNPNNIRFSRNLKALLDEATENNGGKLYKQARKARRQFAEDYESVSLVDNIMNNKRGTSDRAIALENILNQTVISPSTSLDTLKKVRRLLQTSGEDGMRAWREIQGGTIKYIRDEATRNVARDERGNPVVSAAALNRVIKNLDRSGKLEALYGKDGANQLRIFNDVAGDVLTSPPGVINTSNTASVILAALDIGISGLSGVPAPVMSAIGLATKKLKNARLNAKVRQSLGKKGAKE